MPLFGQRIPREVKLLPSVLTKIDQSIYKNVLKYVLTTLEGGTNRRTLEDTLGSLSDVDNENVTIALSGLFCLLRALFRAESEFKPESLQAELEVLKLPLEVISDVTKIVTNQRSRTLHDTKFKPIQYPTIEKFNWRVDVSISTSSLCRVLEPTVNCELTLSNGEIKHFEMPMKVFHNLRCQVATVLKEMHHIEQREYA